jgi:hypothetical protein
LLRSGRADLSLALQAKRAPRRPGSLCDGTGRRLLFLGSCRILLLHPSVYPINIISWDQWLSGTRAMPPCAVDLGNAITTIRNLPGKEVVNGGWLVMPQHVTALDGQIGPCSRSAWPPPPRPPYSVSFTKPLTTGRVQREIERGPKWKPYRRKEGTTLLRSYHFAPNCAPKSTPNPSFMFQHLLQHPDMVAKPPTRNRGLPAVGECHKPGRPTEEKMVPVTNRKN